ncbi:MAG: HAMP domain-containing protein [Coriobacteriia bacterium]|nr:HAMP domain-containing protein [Coriobacteriia bacterium]
MRLSSIRARVALLSAFFALVLVGSVTVATYVFVARGMDAAAEDTANRLLSAAERVIVRLTIQAEADAERAGLTGVEAESFIGEELMVTLPEVLSQGLIHEGSYALYAIQRPGEEPVLRWSGGDDAGEGRAEIRNQVFSSGVMQHDHPLGRPILRGLVVSADLGAHVSHVPVDIPGTHAAILDVIYMPTREEAVLNAMRLPMILVTVLALGAALLLTSLLLRWALSLIENIKVAADSIDVGQLDVHLPEQGDNEIAELARSLNRLIDNLRRRNEAQTRFVADASHELATPVAGIRGYVNILRAWGLEDEGLREEAITAIDRESRRMARLCSDLLSVIRSEEMVDYRSIRYDINGVCREVLASAATRYMAKGFEFVAPDEAPLWLYGDPDRIAEALGILVDNACKYTPAAGTISVTTRRRRDRVIVQVSDNGVGIPTEDLPNVFERFYRSDVSRSQETGGFGLGLAIAKHIVDASGGGISVESALGQGTTFEIALPRRKAGA